MSEVGSSSGTKTSGRPRGRPLGSKNKNSGASRGCKANVNTSGSGFQVTDANSGCCFQFHASTPSFSSNSRLNDASAPPEDANSSKWHKLETIQENQRLSPVESLSNLQQGLHPHANLPPRPSLVPTVKEGSCVLKLLEYLHRICRPPRENSIEYWNSFVNHYYATQAKLRWCLSSYGNFGVFPQTHEAVPCGLCDSRSGDGFEAAAEALPRINQIQFELGIIDEFSFLSMPHESQHPSGVLVLWYEKAVQKTAYKQLCVVRSGQLQIAFTPELKILTWEFCPERHEEFFNRGSIAPQMNQLLLLSEMYETSVTESGSSGYSNELLEANYNMFIAVSQQMARCLGLQALNGWGFSKSFVHRLQKSQVLGSMKDLMGINLEHKMGALGSLKSYPWQVAEKSQTQQMQVEQNHPNRTAATQAGMRTSFNFPNDPQKNFIDPNRVYPSMILANNCVDNNNNNDNLSSCPEPNDD